VTRLVHEPAPIEVAKASLPAPTGVSRAVTAALWSALSISIQETFDDVSFGQPDEGKHRQAAELREPITEVIASCWLRWQAGRSVQSDNQGTTMSEEIRYNVAISYGTMASNPDEALLSALSVVADRTGGYIEITEDATNKTGMEGELAGLNLKAETVGEPVEAEAGADDQYNVVFSYTTFATNETEALGIALSVIDERSGGYVEVFDGKPFSDDAVLEGDLPVVVLAPESPFKIKLVFDPADVSITQASSARLKTAFNAYFAEHGLPDNTAAIADETVRKLAEAYQDEFGEVCETFEREGAFKI
jgi:hypothetical protein